jgi:hypothetical protein
MDEAVLEDVLGRSALDQGGEPVGGGIPLDRDL